MTDFESMTLKELSKLRRSWANTANRNIRNYQKQFPGKRSAITEISNPYFYRQGRKKKRYYEGKGTMPVSLYTQTAKGPRKATAKEIEARQRRAEIAELRNLELLRSKKTATVAGYKAGIKKARKGFKEAVGVELTDEQLDIMFESNAFGWLRRTVGSSTMLAAARAIASGNATADEITKRIQSMHSRFDEWGKFKNMPINDLFESELGIPFKPEYLQTGGR